MASKRELEERVSELEEALEETRSLIDQALGIEPDEEAPDEEEEAEE